MDAADSLRLTETFVSLQGESRTVGLPTFFIRLTGCPLRCHYCDTAYAFHGGRRVALEAVVAEACAAGVGQVTVTGGEPLAQPACLALLRRLCEVGLAVSLETSGALDIAAIDPRVSRVVDLKTPGSGEAHRNRWENLACLQPHDQLKFVLCSRQDYLWARTLLRRERLERRCEVLFSPSAEQLEARRLADWIVEDRLPVRFQLQLHKLLWNDEPGR